MNAFVQVDGIPGESQDSDHKDWIQPSSFSFSVSQQKGGPRSDAGTTAKGNAQFSDFVIVKRIDKASVKLLLECAKGSNIKNVTLQVHRAAGNKELYYQVEMQDVLITSVSPAGNEGADDLPMEAVGMNFGKVKVKYVHYDGPTKKGEFKSGWDAVQDKEIAG